jgi:hypothetical protein
MDIAKALVELQQQRDQIDEAILSLERPALGNGKRRGRPPAWKVAARKLPRRDADDHPWQRSPGEC